jgi:hypothetical protein
MLCAVCCAVLCASVIPVRAVVLCIVPFNCRACCVLCAAPAACICVLGQAFGAVHCAFCVLCMLYAVCCACCVCLCFQCALWCLVSCSVCAVLCCVRKAKLLLEESEASACCVAYAVNAVCAEPVVCAVNPVCVRCAPRSYYQQASATQS